MKMRIGTYPVERKLFDEDGDQVGSKADEDFLFAFEVTKKEFKKIFGETKAEELNPREVLAGILDNWQKG